MHLKWRCLRSKGLLHVLFVNDHLKAVRKFRFMAGRAIECRGAKVYTDVAVVASRCQLPSLRPRRVGRLPISCLFPGYRSRFILQSRTFLQQVLSPLSWPVSGRLLLRTLMLLVPSYSSVSSFLRFHRARRHITRTIFPTLFLTPCAPPLPSCSFPSACIPSRPKGVAVQNIALALAVVFLSIAVLARFAVATLVASLVLGTTLGTVGLVRRASFRRAARLVTTECGILCQ